MSNTEFTPHHINATAADLAGNNGIGRYIFLPGSDGRAKEIAQHFDNVVIKQHSRGHDLYLGTITHQGQTIDVASIASGMGCPSMEIILHELFKLGAKRFLRIGTAGSLQPNMVRLGDLVNAQASVRDERTTTDYVPLEVPALASLEFTSAILLSAEKLGLSDNVHTGTIHCKGSFYAREFGHGPMKEQNNKYMDLLSECGVLASEMETASLFIQSQLYDFELRQLDGRSPEHRVMAGAILAIIAVPPQHIKASELATTAIHNAISLALEAVRTMAANECLK